MDTADLAVRVYETLAPLHGKVDAQTVSFVRRMFTSLAEWHHEWDAIHRQHHSGDSVLVKLLEAELVYAQLWTVCVALRGCAWDKVRGGYPVGKLTCPAAARSTRARFPCKGRRYGMSRDLPPLAQPPQAS